MSATIIGLLTLIGAQFVPVEEIEKVIEAIGILLAWYGRYRIGDITILGIRKWYNT